MVRAIIYLSFVVLLAGDIQLNPGPDADCAQGVHAAGVGPGSDRLEWWACGSLRGASVSSAAVPEVVRGFPVGDSCGSSVQTSVRAPAPEDTEGVAPCARVDRSTARVAPADGPVGCWSDLAQSCAFLLSTRRRTPYWRRI